MPLSIFIADEHTLFRELLCETLPRKKTNWTIVGEAADGKDAVQRLAYTHPDVLLLDYPMPGLRRLSVLCQEVRRKSPRTQILILSDVADEHTVVEAAHGGASGYILKGASINTLIQAIQYVEKGEIWIDPQLSQDLFRAFLRQGSDSESSLAKLSKQELRIMSLVVQGMTNKEIAAHLYLSIKTVKNHLTRILAKLGAERRGEIVRYLYRHAENGGPSPWANRFTHSATGFLKCRDEQPCEPRRRRP
jgi:DNA-binding NarL/FixJ family response regulator